MKDKGIRLRGFVPEIVKVGEDGVAEEEVIRHDETNPAFAYLLSQMRYPEFPIPIGVFRAVEYETYDQAVQRQIREARSAHKPGTLDQLLRQGDVWESTGKNGA